MLRKRSPAIVVPERSTAMRGSWRAVSSPPMATYDYHDKMRGTPAVNAMTAPAMNDDICPRCGKPVYHAERRIAEGRSYHPTCYTCRVCDNSLNATNIAPSPDEIFCKVCYGRVRGPRGYGFGLGGKGVFSMTMTSLQVEGIDHIMHKPAMMGALDNVQELSANQRRDEHPMSCTCKECMRALKFTKVQAHDHMMTSNAGHVSMAYAWPMLAKERSLPPSMSEADRHRQHMSGRTRSGHRHQSLTVAPIRDEPIAFLRRQDAPNIELSTGVHWSHPARARHVRNR